MQTDGYAGYDRVGGPEMIHAACWAHARRKFYEAAKLHPADAVATRIVASINELLAIDARASAQKLDHTARHQLRQQEATPLLESLRSEIKAALHGALPASALGKACNYTLSLWQKLTRFLEHPQLELSNNLAENSMRPIALGRKNWIHLGASRPDPRSPPSSPSWKPANGSTSRSETTWLTCCLGWLTYRLPNSTTLHLPPGKQPS